MQHDKLVTMANQIATFYESQPEPDRTQGTLVHLKDFWDPRMKAALREIAAKPDNGLSPLALSAAQNL
jgi:formate dehydrogenase subunit delta